MFAAIVGEKGLFYQWTIDAQVPGSLKGDPQRLKQVLVNLINNAIKFTAHGGVAIQVGLLPCEKTGSHRLLFTVKDSGEGIPEEKLHLIFDRFEQLEHSTIRQHGGTGLGLSIVKSIVERMGGAVAVQSIVGQGSEFTFTAIFEEVAAAAKNTAKEAAAVTADFSGFTVLVVEDNRANRQLIKLLLRKHKLDIDLAENGREALEKVKERSYDLIIMDIQMPQMDGYSAITAMRQELQLHTPAIAMTAYVMENEIRRCFASGFNDYISKPVQEKELVAMITKYLYPPLENNLAGTAAGNSGIDFLKELTNGDESIMQELLAEIKTQWSADKLELKAAIKTGNREEAGRILHRAKSTFSVFGPGNSVLVLLNTDIASVNDRDIIKECDRVIKGIDKEMSFIFEKN